MGKRFLYRRSVLVRENDKNRKAEGIVLTSAE